MVENKRLIVVGCMALALFAVIRFPASTAFSWFAPAGVGAFGIEGTIWNGKARLINAPGLQFRNTEWDVAAWRLLIGQLGGDFNTRWGGGFVEASGNAGIGGKISLRNIRGSFDIRQLNSVLGTPDIGGVATVDLSELVLKNSWPTRIVGSGQLKNLTSPLMGRGAAQLIGDIGFEFDADTETDSETVTGKLRDTGGPLQLEGSLLLTPPGNYDLKARLKARETAAESLRRNLMFLGAPEPDGNHIFQLAGSI